MPKKSPDLFQQKMMFVGNDYESIVLQKRNVFLFGEVESDYADMLIKQLFFLESINSKPIKLWINSGGGECSAGLAIMNTLLHLRAPVITIVNAEAASMAAMIAICGKERWIVKTGVIMFHEASGGISGDYVSKIKDRAKFLENYSTMMDQIYRERTKLTEKDIQRATNGELWLFSQEALEKGVVDKIV